MTSASRADQPLRAPGGRGEAQAEAAAATQVAAAAADGRPAAAADGGTAGGGGGATAVAVAATATAGSVRAASRKGHATPRFAVHIVTLSCWSAATRRCTPEARLRPAPAAAAAPRGRPGRCWFCRLRRAADHPSIISALCSHPARSSCRLAFQAPYQPASRPLKAPSRVDPNRARSKTKRSQTVLRLS